MSYIGPTQDHNVYTSMMVSPWSREGNTVASNTINTPSSTTYPSATRIFYNRVYIPSQCTAYKLFWLNGATAATNNVQVGIYSDDGTNKPGAAVIRGTSTLAAGANACQYDNIADTPLGPGIYWLAIWCNGTTTTLFSRSTSSAIITPGMYIETAAGGLPTSATPTSAGTSGRTHVYGITTRATP